MEGAGAAFYWNACPVCASGSARVETRALLRCGGCRRVWYCGRAHQRRHWLCHQPLCRAVQQLPPPDADAPLQWRQARLLDAVMAELLVGRPLTPFERQMFLLPRACEVCKAPDAALECESCRCVCYCGDAHRRGDAPHHARVCEELQLCRRLELGDAAYLGIPQEPAPSAQSSQSDQVSKFPANMREQLSAWGLCQKEVAATSSELMSCPLTLLYVLLRARRSLPTPAELRVHVVGAGALEGNSFAWELLLHRLPALQLLRFAFIGPDAQLPAPEALCADCTSRGRAVQMESHSSTFYHDYCLSNSYSEPDVIVAFNCGFLEYNESETDSWNKSMPFFFHKPQTLLIFTSYTLMEAEKDLEIVKSFSGNNVEVLLEKEENPFCSLQPHRDWDSHRSCVFYFNKFLSAFLVTN